MGCDLPCVLHCQIIVPQVHTGRGKGEKSNFDLLQNEYHLYDWKLWLRSSLLEDTFYSLQLPSSQTRNFSLSPIYRILYQSDTAHNKFFYRQRDDMHMSKFYSPDLPSLLFLLPLLTSNPLYPSTLDLLSPTHQLNSQ
ncbi:hypothetical protein ES703_111809 [subsurface metagenome]